MIFGELPTNQAEDPILAHTLKVPGRTWCKGRVLTGDDVVALVAAGIERVAGARLAAGELSEDVAAAEIASLNAGEHLVARPPHNGRCNLYASAPGLLQVDRECVDRLNAIDEAVTLGTLHPCAPVLKDRRVATVKIIPFGVPADVIDAWRRIAAGLPVDGAALMGMGVGGLLHGADDPIKEEGETPPAPAAGSAPRVAALVLAAGTSSRMGGQNKLLRVFDGLPLVQHAVDAALASRCTQVLVVTGCEAESVESTLDRDRVSIVRNPEYASGMSTSLRCGLAALPTDLAAVLVVLADMPRVSAAYIDRIVGAFDPDQPTIVVPTFQGRRGNPVLWPRCYFAELRGIVGDTGARGLLETHAADVISVPIESDAILADVDTPADLADLLSK